VGKRNADAGKKKKDDCYLPCLKEEEESGEQGRGTAPETLGRRDPAAMGRRCSEAAARRRRAWIPARLAGASSEESRMGRESGSEFEIEWKSPRPFPFD
jgi:hypothetical protein